MKTLLALLTIALGLSANAEPVKMAITVDDLPIAGLLPPGVTREKIAKDMIATFKKHGVPEVYGFINAGKLKDDKKFIDILKSWRAAGFPLGNHTSTHMSLSKNSAADYIKDIQENEATLKSLAGKTDWKYYRYPFLEEGETLEKRNAVREHLKKNGYKIAQVTIDFKDWAWNDAYALCKKAGDEASLKWLKESYMKNVDDVFYNSHLVSQAVFRKNVSHILLLHIGGMTTEMLDETLKVYKKAGVKFVSLEEAMKDDIYSIDPKVATSNGLEFPHQVMQSRGQTPGFFGLDYYQGFPKDKLEKICR